MLPASSRLLDAICKYKLRRTTVKCRRLLRLPDCMFAHVPTTLPKAGSGEMVRLTWGGAMTGAQFRYQQLQTAYCGATGRLLTLSSFTY